MRVQTILSTCVLLAVIGGSARAQAVDITDIMSGKNVPLTITLKDLDTSWRVFEVEGASSSINPWLSALTGGPASSDFFTKGDTVTAGAETYLVAYRPHAQPIDYQALMSNNGKRPSPQSLSKSSTLDLALLNLHTISGMSDIRPFDLKAEISSSQKSAGEIASLYGGARTVSESDASSENLKQLSLALLQYVQDYDEDLPDMTSFAAVKKVLKPYTKDETFFTDRNDNKPYRVNTSISTRTLASFDNPAEMVVFYEADPTSDGTRAVSFLDGHVKRLTQSQWDQARAKSHIK